MKTPKTIRPLSLRHKAPNYLQGFWLNLLKDCYNKLAIRRAKSVLSKILPLLKGRFSFKLRWEHVVISFLLGALLLRGGPTHIIKSTYVGVSPAPAIMQAKTLPKLKDVSYAVQDTLQPIWVSKLRPPGTYTNGYDLGQCTSGIASRLPIPNDWGNANNWAYAATLAGYTVTNTPSAETIAQTSGDSYLGHVALVLSVNSDGSFVIWEQNGIYGPFTTDERTTTTAEFPNFIKI